MDMEEKKQYNDALNTYYKLKSAYENNYDKDKNAIIKMKDFSWKEKRNSFAKLKPKCINCKRPVGSLFYTSIDKGERTLVAKCGDKTKPCPLNIVIKLGYIMNLRDELSVDEKSVSDIKKDIIIDKNDLLFGYITSKEAVSKFDSIKETYSSTSVNYEYLLNMLNDIVDNKDKKNELKREEAEAQLTIDNIKKMMEDFEKTQNVQFVNDVVDIYVKQLTPRLKKIMKEKYAYSGVDYDSNDNTYNLIQIPVSIENLENDVADDPQSVVSLRMGMEKTEKKNPGFW